MKQKYSPKKLAIIILFGFIMFGVFGYLYNKNSYEETWIVCEFPNKYNYYKETIKYRFLSSDMLYGFYRYETFLESTDMTLKEREDYFLNIKKDIVEDANFQYNVTNDGIKVEVNTYINTREYQGMFESYIKDFGINSISSIEEVNTKMTDKGYKCNITRK